MSYNQKYLEEWNIIKESLMKNKNHSSKWFKIFDEYQDIQLEECKQHKDYKHAAHAFIWSKNDAQLWKMNSFAAILMQMRFDGFMGFPGGFIDPTDQSIEDGLNRELKEEINLDEKYFINPNDRFFINVNHKRKLILYFYLKEVSKNEFENIEKTSMSSHDYGGEVMGIIRPPLYEIKPGRGFNIFIQNQFVGNSLYQLLRSINYLGILPLEKILFFIEMC